MKSSSIPERLRILVDAYCTDAIAADELRELEAILASDARARRYLAAYCRMHAGLIFALRADHALQSARLTPPPIAPVAGAWHGAVSFFSQTGPLSYLLAVVITAAILLAAWAYQINHPREQFVRNNPENAQPVPNTESAFVGRVTGMKDCQWSDPDTQTFVGASVSLDREYALASGLLEITYKSGARVILEGPCTYKADSDTGGFLARGKLTARIEERGEGRGERAKPQAVFSVKTPTAIVTDLGTEFGVEVDENGDTVSCVFQGSIKVQGLSASADSGDSQEEKVLRINESIRVSRVRETHQDSATKDTVRYTHPTTLPKFARRIPKAAYKTFDLVDVVAGGDGFSGRRDCGIDTTTGKTVAEMRSPLPPNVKGMPKSSDRQYHRVETLPFVDGVFIPHDGGQVRVDSAGHEFSDFGVTQSAAWQIIWAGGKPTKTPYPTRIGDVDYATPQHGFLLLHANAAITFDLEAIRQANPGRKLSRFSAVAANNGKKCTEIIESVQFADIWVLVDGLVRCRQRQEDSEWKYNGIRSISVSIGDADRFLTLASTDAGDGISGDWVIFGDPCLEFHPSQPNQNEGGRGMKNP